MLAQRGSSEHATIEWPDLESTTSSLCRVTLRELNGELTLEVRGDLDASSMPALSEQIDQLQCTPCTRAVLDMRNVSTIDRVGLNAVAGLAHYVAQRGGTFVIRCRPGAIRGLLISTGLSANLEDPEASAPTPTRSG